MRRIQTIKGFSELVFIIKCNSCWDTSKIKWGCIVMDIKKLLYRIKPPCSKCPYKLGHVYFVTSPCPQCKINNYEMYRILAKGKYKHPQTMN